MKRTIQFILGFALLGALVGACLPIFVGTRQAVTYGLPYWYDDYLNPVVVVWVLTIPIGLFLGALTGLASAFCSGCF